MMLYSPLLAAASLSRQLDASPASFVLSGGVVDRFEKATLTLTGFDANFVKGINPTIIEVGNDPTFLYGSYQRVGTGTVLSENGMTLLLRAIDNELPYTQVYRRSGDAWNYEAEIGPGANPISNRPALISGNGSVAVVSQSGGWYAYRRQSNGTWTAYLLTSSANLSMGDISYDGSRIALGNAVIAVLYPVQIYDWSGSSYPQTATVVAAAATSTSYFGKRVQLSYDGNRLMVSSFGTGDYNVYEFTYSGSTWSEIGATATAKSDSMTLAKRADIFITRSATSNSIDVYRLSGGTWTPETVNVRSMTPPYTGSFGPFAISCYGDRLFVATYSAYMTDTTTGTADTGAAYEYAFDGSSWNYIRDYRPGPAYPGVQFCYAFGVASSGNTLIGGAPKYGSPQWVGGAMAFFRRLSLSLASTSYTLTGFDADLVKAAFGKSLNLGSTTFLMTGVNAALVKTDQTNKVLAAASASFSLTGKAIYQYGLRVGKLASTWAAANLYIRRMTASPKALTCTGASATLFKTAPVPGYVYLSEAATQLPTRRFARLSPDGTRVFACVDTQWPSLDIYTKSGTTLTLEQSLSNPATASGYPDFGKGAIAISADGAHVLVGAKYEADDQSGGLAYGAVYYYSRTGTNWTLRQRIQPALVKTAYGSSPHFGWAIAMSSDGLTAVVSAPDFFDGSGNNGGLIYVLKRSSYTWTASLVDAPYMTGHIGRQLDISADGNTIVYQSERTSAEYLSFKIRKWNGSAWNVTATISGATTIEAVAVNADGTGIVRCNRSGTDYYTLFGSIWQFAYHSDMSNGLALNDAIAFSSDCKRVALYDYNWKPDPNTQADYTRIMEYSCNAPESSAYDANFFAIPKFLSTPVCVSSSSDHSNILVVAIGGGDTDATYYWYKRIPSIVFGAAAGEVVLNRYPAALGRKFNLPPKALTLTPSTVTFFKGKGILAATGSYTITGRAITPKIAFRANPGSFAITEAPIKFMRVKGSINSTPRTLTITAPPAKVARIITLTADSMAYHYSAPDSQVARIFTLRAGAGALTMTGGKTSNALKAIMAPGSFTYAGAAARTRYLHWVNAQPGSFFINLEASDMRRPFESSTPTLSADAALVGKTVNEVIHAET